MATMRQIILEALDKVLLEMSRAPEIALSVLRYLSKMRGGAPITTLGSTGYYLVKKGYADKYNGMCIINDEGRKLLAQYDGSEVLE